MQNISKNFSTKSGSPSSMLHIQNNKKTPLLDPQVLSIYHILVINLKFCEIDYGGKLLPPKNLINDTMTTTLPEQPKFVTSLSKYGRDWACLNPSI